MHKQQGRNLVFTVQKAAGRENKRGSDKSACTVSLRKIEAEREVRPIDSAAPSGGCFVLFFASV